MQASNVAVVVVVEVVIVKVPMLCDFFIVSKSKNKILVKNVY
jgi:hypothetical protein